MATWLYPEHAALIPHWPRPRRALLGIWEDFPTGDCQSPIFHEAQSRYILDNAHEPKHVVPEDTSVQPAILRLHAAEIELRSSRPMMLAAKRTENRHVVIRDPEAFKSQNNVLSLKLKSLTCKQA